MKKILISILIILLIILISFSIIKGVDFLKIKSINNIKTTSEKLDNEINEANELSNKIYPEEVQGLEEAIKVLKTSKQEYESKKTYGIDDDMLGAVEIKTYKIHYLWTKLGNYRKDRKLQTLTLNLVSTQGEDIYDLEFTLIGSYTNITDFIYDIENDEELNFEIKNLKITSQIDNTNNNADNTTNTTNSTHNTTNTTNNSNNTTNKNNTNNNATVQKNDGYSIQAKFTVEDVGITLD